MRTGQGLAKDEDGVSNGENSLSKKQSSLSKSNSILIKRRKYNLVAVLKNVCKARY